MYIRGSAHIARYTPTGNALSVPHFIGVLLFCLICTLHPLSALAQITVTFPLEGHYRPGRYMPVHVLGSATGKEFTLQSDGSLPLSISTASGSVDVTAPWLTTSSSLQNAVWIENGEHPLATGFEPLTDNQRLVALAGIEAAEARAIFSDAEIVPVHLDVTDPLPGSPAAWEALDGLMLDENAAARVTNHQLRTLLAAGTTVAIRSDRRPGGTWPWKRAGAYWVVAHLRAGPESLIEPAAYGPTYGWVRGLPWPTRRRALLGGLIVCVLLIGAAFPPLRRIRGISSGPFSLSPGTAGEAQISARAASSDVSLTASRNGVLAVGSVAIATSLLWIAWQGRQPPLSTLAAQVVSQVGSLTQHDRWTWISSPVALETTFAAGELTHPIFFTHSQLAATQMRVVCDGNDEPISFRFHLEPRLAIAFVDSTVDTESDRHSLSTTRSSFSAMAEEVYANPALTVAGGYDDTDGSQTVVGQFDETPK